MTTYIPSLTLPSVIFENAALSVLLPIAAGTAVGFSTQRKTNNSPVQSNNKYTDFAIAVGPQQQYAALKQPVSPILFPNSCLSTQLTPHSKPSPTHKYFQRQRN
jgi:hypothetical protein